MFSQSSNGVEKTEGELMIVKLIKTVFITIIGVAFGLVVSGLLKLDPHVSIGLTIGTALVFGVSYSQIFAKKVYQETEEAVHGHPIKTLFLWLVMFVVLALGLIFLGAKTQILKGLF